MSFMPWMRRLAARRGEREIDDEPAFRAEMETRANIARGTQLRAVRSARHPTLVSPCS